MSITVNSTFLGDNWSRPSGNPGWRFGEGEALKAHQPIDPLGIEATEALKAYLTRVANAPTKTYRFDEACTCTRHGPDIAFLQEEFGRFQSEWHD